MKINNTFKLVIAIIVSELGRHHRLSIYRAGNQIRLV